MTIADKYNFYQSSLWTHINRDIFLKPTFQVDFEGKSYQVICKEKKLLGVILVRYQILGLESGVFSDKSTIQLFKESLLQGARNYYQGKIFISLYIQCGFTTVLMKNKVVHLKTDEQACITEFGKTKIMSDNQKLSRGLRKSKKHNLPDSTIVIDLSKTSDELRSEIGRNTKDKIKKTEKLIQKDELSFHCSYEVSDYDLFFDLYKKTAGNKGFGAITGGMRERLMKSALNEGFGRLFVIKNSSGIAVSSAFCILDSNILIYLYGANDRSYGNIGVSQFLHRNIIQFAKNNSILYYDLLGASALGSKNDRLEHVTQFKLGFGGEKLEYEGSRDIPISKVGYYAYSFF